MRFRIRVVRAQVAERVVRATDEDAAIEKVRAELAEPYGWFGRWETTNTEVEVVGEEPSVAGIPVGIDGGPLLLSVKEAAKMLGIPAGRLYELVNTGEIEAFHLGRRRMISRETLNRFVEANTRAGR
jgi:excisionase family DNA binding protein